MEQLQALPWSRGRQARALVRARRIWRRIVRWADLAFSAIVCIVVLVVLGIAFICYFGWTNRKD